MGCNIHVMTEYKQILNGVERWFNCDNWRYNPYYGTDKHESKMDLKEIYQSRNYELFSFLADVRNYDRNPSFGFDRGFPEDADEITRKEYDLWGEDAHTPGYCTLKELKEAAEGVKTVRYEGAVLKEEADRFRSTGKIPTRWAQGTETGNGIAPEHADKFEWLVWEKENHCCDLLISAIEERKRDVFWIFNSEMDDFSKDSEIRIVFWFDN